MAYISYDKLWGGDFYKIISAKDRVQDIPPNQNRTQTKQNPSLKMRR